MDDLEDRRAPAFSAHGAAPKNSPIFQKSKTFRHQCSPRSFSFLEKEKCKNGSGGGGGGGGLSVGAVATAKAPYKHIYEDPRLAGLDDGRAASTLRRSSSLSHKSVRAAVAKWGAAAATSKHDAAAAAAKVVLYTTSLRGIRRTFEDCCAVRSILRGFRVAVDERDVSMDASLRKELQGLLGGGRKSPPVPLPQVFVGERWLGGAEEIRQMFESGDLRKLLERVPRQDPRFVCLTCGGMRFLPCGSCSGSRKVFNEEDGQPRRCPDCNENGLVRCLDCC